ncbi:hypothetical protein [Enterocloster bolteae]|uniref:hypothetical protein n=1 Tax=Enterocloster bolteae TaxID=208479 RepID=UPI0034B613A0
MNLAATPWNEKEGYETMLIIKYERIDFFYSRIYTEDKKQNHTKEDLKKAFLYFSRTYDTSIQIDDTVIFWDSLVEYENRIVAVRYFDGMSYTETKKSYDKAKKECYAMTS